MFDRIEAILTYIVVGAGILTLMIGALAILDGQITLGGWIGAIFGL